ncbi:hypothetical protein C7S13_6241 [Burkholderia cepacia]|nr:hypothetical protein [Burkholderia cepacia]
METPSRRGSDRNVKQRVGSSWRLLQSGVEIMFAPMRAIIIDQ